MNPISNLSAFCCSPLEHSEISSARGLLSRWDSQRGVISMELEEVDSTH